MAICFSAPSSSSVSSCQNDVSSFPVEFRDLIQKLNRSVSFEEFDRRTIYPNLQSKRKIYIATSEDEKGKTFIKRPQGKRIFLNQPYAKQEQLAFMISDRLNFGVVPPTIAFQGYKVLIQRVSQAARVYLNNGIDDSYKGVVIQEGVTLHSHQFHMDEEVIRSGITSNIKHNLTVIECDRAIREDGRKAVSNLNLDVDHLCKAIFFNIVSGRTDAGTRNTVVDRSKRVMEIDNEYIGGTKTNSWLIRSFADCVLSKNVINDFLNKDITIIDGIFRDLMRFPPTFFWNDQTCKFDIEDRSKMCISRNFIKLREFLLRNQKAEIEIKVSDLTSMFYKQDAPI